MGCRLPPNTSSTRRPRSAEEKPPWMMHLMTVQRTTLGTGFGGKEAQSRVVRWVKRGDRILMCGFGAGLTWGTAILRW
jgi:hypothetical protein